MFGQNRQALRSVQTTDYGPEPFVFDIDKAAVQNSNFRTTQWTGKHMQVTLMSIPPGGEIGLEIHPDVDQFLRIESGKGLVKMGRRQNMLAYQRKASNGYAIIIPAGTWHNVTNIGVRPLQLYSIYTPVQHPRGTVHRTKAEADMAEAAGK